MAPPDGATGKNQTTKINSSRSVREPVVPALPITFSQRFVSHAASSSTRAAAAESESPAALAAETSSSLTAATAARIGERATKAVNQSQAKAAGEISTAAEEKKRDAVAATTTTHEPHAETGKGVSESNSPSGLDAVTPSVVPVQTAAAGAPSSLPYHAPDASNGTLLGTPIARYYFHPAVLEQAAASSTVTRVQQLPSFNPANRQATSPTAPAFVRDVIPPFGHIPAMNRPHMHHPHPSNVSLVFGVFNGSNASSPAPHPSGGFPPPGTIPYHPGGMPVATVDMYGRPLMVSPIADGFPPAAVHNQGPPTPHSFQGSQSPAHADEAHSTQHPVVDGHDSLARLPPSLSAVPPHHMGSGFVGPHPTSSLSYLDNQIQQDALQFLRHGADNPEMSDCVLEVRLLDKPRYIEQGLGDGQTMKFSGHQFILCYSPTLRQLLQSRDPADRQHVVIELRDEYMRTDAFYFALRTLYGWNLESAGILHHYIPVRGIKDEFDLALGYMAAAHYLQLSAVHAIALQRAVALLGWETLEQACKFVLPRVIFARVAGPAPASSHDNCSIAELEEHIVVFLASNISADFVLDTMPGEWEFSRLPVIDPIMPPPSSPPGISTGAPVVVNGTDRPNKVYSSDSQLASLYPQFMPHPRTSTDPRLSSIKFGDISPAKYNNGYGFEGKSGATPAKRPPSPAESILSRVLLNLPFELLKQVLEHPALGSIWGELSPPVRYRVVADIVAERESRRLATLDKRNTRLRVFHETLDRAAEPLTVLQMGDFLVNNMGFKEEVLVGDEPYLFHSWTRGNSEGSSC